MDTSSVLRDQLRECHVELVWNGMMKQNLVNVKVRFVVKITGELTTTWFGINSSCIFAFVLKELKEMLNLLLALYIYEYNVCLRWWSKYVAYHNVSVERFCYTCQMRAVHNMINAYPGPKYVQSFFFLFSYFMHTEIYGYTDQVNRLKSFLFGNSPAN